MNYYELFQRLVLWWLRKIVKLNHYLAVRSEVHELKKKSDKLDWE